MVCRAGFTYFSVKVRIVLTPQVDVIIKLCKNGFTVNDGELRSYADVASQQFLDSVKKG